MVEEPTKPAFLIVAKYAVTPADVVAFKLIAQRMAEGGRKRAGNLFLNAAQDLSDPNTFDLIEGWASPKAADDHLKSGEFQPGLKEALAPQIADRSGKIYFVSHVQPLVMPL